MIPINLGLGLLATLREWPRYANNQITYPSPNAKGEQPTNLGLGLLATLREWPRYANNLQPSTLALAYWPRYANGHATRTTFNLQPWPWPIGHATRMATLREQPSTYPTPNCLGRTTN
ncbi:MULTISPECIES: hypothetical protein [unclassified Moorena]|uniref:hypothetical protein n=1 Tax=unclassified Moorena TaxID=2683338 RepID=UPI0013CA7ABA|nr:MULTISPECIES: hypothetical protein [unclassified Moorena]NEO21560.1 hypothetical protein [Moorena sp. SIO4A5]NEQ61076.1 hypothetical protein [Moorena sp. SIO4A1]